MQDQKEVNETKLSLEITDVFASVSELNEKVLMLTEENDKLKKQIDELNNRQPVIKKTMPPLANEQLKAEIQTLNDKVAKLQQDNKALNIEKEMLLKEKEQSKVAINEYTKKMDLLESKIEQFEKGIPALLSLPEAYVKESNLLESEKKEMVNLFDLKMIEETLTHDKKLLTEMKNENNELCNKLKKLITENNKLSTVIDSIIGKSQIEKQVMKNKEDVWKKKDELYNQRNVQNENEQKLFTKCECISNKIEELLAKWKANESVTNQPPPNPNENEKEDKKMIETSGNEPEHKDEPKQMEEVATPKQMEEIPAEKKGQGMEIIELDETPKTQDQPNNDHFDVDLL